MRKPSHVLAALSLVLAASCGGGAEDAMLKFSSIYGELADVLSSVDDASSAEAAKPKIEVLVPRIFDAGKSLAEFTGSSGGKPDIRMEVMMACAQQQERVSVQIRRLRGDEELWSTLEPTLEKTMLLKAMPSR